MSDSTPTLENPRETFRLDSRPEQSLEQLVESAGFDDIHFFLAEALRDGAIDAEPADEDTTFALLPYEHPDDEFTDETFELLKEEGFEQATFRDLLNFAIERPDAQREHDIVALGTLRTRRIYDDADDREGETVWDQTELDQSICQWATGLSNFDDDRTLIPIEIYLDDVLRKDALILVREE